MRITVEKQHSVQEDPGLIISSHSLVVFLLMFFMSGFAMADTKKTNLENLETKTIYFGHQSVGDNIVKGMEALIAEMPNLNLIIKQTDNPDDLKPGMFAHSPVGFNEKPTTKDLDFAKKVDAFVSQKKVDLAFYKYCYIDINRDTDIPALFKVYRENYEKVTSKHKDTKFVHLTVPLTVVQTGPRAWVKKIIGRPIGGYAENQKRHEFNELLRKEFGNSGLLFDLARLESTRQDGSRETFSVDGQSYEALVDEYASDGRHLNLDGSKYIAKELLEFLSDK